MPADLSSRRRVPERMDQPGLDPGEHARALRGLGRINRVSRSVQVFWPAIARLAWSRGTSTDPIRVLDLASGGGDVPIGLARRAAREERNVRIEGCDLNPIAVEIARGQAKTSMFDVPFSVRDALEGPLPEGFDVLTCSLFLHHLDDADAEALLARMAEATGRLVLVDDLIRSRLGRLMAEVGCRLLSRSSVVHFDGPASVAAAFTPGEAAGLASRAGLVGATITRHWPERFLLAWSRP